jgi:DNA-binding PadR family transcriptional regulator
MARAEEEHMTTEPSLELDDLIVLLLGAPSQKPSLQDRLEGVTRLEKLVFLLEKESPIRQLLAEEAEFRSHNFGPFSSKLYQAVDMLAAAGLLEDSSDLGSSTEDSWEAQTLIGGNPSDPYATRNFALTDKGRRYFDALKKEVPESYIKDLTEFKDRFASLPLRRLVRFVYEKYPDYTDKSLIRDEILG